MEQWTLLVVIAVTLSSGVDQQHSEEVTLMAAVTSGVPYTQSIIHKESIRVVNNFIVPNSKLQIFIHGYLFFVCVVFLPGFVSTTVHALAKKLR